MKIHPLRLGQIKSFCLLWFVYCFTYFLRKPIGVVKSDIGSELKIAKTELGWCDLALTLPYAGVQIVFPSLTHKIGARRLLAWCLALAGVSTGLTYTLLADHLASLCLGLALTGAMLAPTHPAGCAALSAWFPDNQLNTVFGFISVAVFTGGLGGTALAAGLQELYGWRSVGLPPSVLSVTTALLIALFLSNPEEAGVTVPGKSYVEPIDEETNNNDKEKKRNGSLWSILKIPCVLQLAGAMFCLKFVRYFMAMWLPLYLFQHLGYTKLEAGLFSTMFDIGGIVGTPLQGILLDKYLKNHQLLSISAMMALGTVFTGLLLITAKYGVILNSICLMIAGAANCGPDSLLAGSVSMTIGEREGPGLGGAVTSLINGFGNIGGIVEGPIIGLLSSYIGWEGVLMTITGVKAVGTLATLAAYRSETINFNDKSKNDSE